MFEADQKLLEYRLQIDAIILNIINERQLTITREDIHQIKEEHGPNVNMDEFNIGAKRTFYKQ